MTNHRPPAGIVRGQKGKKMNAKTRLETADTSTIDAGKLARLPLFVCPPSYHLQRDTGNGCAGDPPGYPTYFTRSVYTGRGNTPARGATLVILGRVVKTAEEDDETSRKRLAGLWKPLPLEHPRTRAWILSTFAHHRNCYHVPGRETLPFHDDGRLLIWPGGCLGKTPFGRVRDLAFETKWKREHESFDKWREEEKDAFRLEIETGNARIIRECEAVAIPENATATGIIRRYYPEFMPTPELFAAGLESPGNWWEVMADTPAPENCPGQYGHPHPVNGSWCQMCGWHSEEK